MRFRIPPRSGCLLDAERLGMDGGSLVKVHTETGYFVIRVWITEAIRPSVVACSHHLGR
jgi:anaerobic selenocysteine-containing dehydrogenase